MKRSLLLAVLLVLVAGSARADVSLDGKAVIHFATAAEGREILTTRDDYLQRLSPFDRAARMKVGRSVSEEEFLTFVGQNVIDWTPAEIKTLEAAIATLRPLLTHYALPFPSTVQLIKTTGAEQADTPYTQGTAIVLTPGRLEKKLDDLPRVFCHELFHILTRRNPALRDKLYAAIGFQKCEEITLPGSLAERKITNPDAPRNDRYIRLTADGKPILAMPILFSRADAYDPERGDEFFAYLTFRFLVLNKTDDPRRLVPPLQILLPKSLILPTSPASSNRSAGTRTTSSIPKKSWPTTSPSSSSEKLTRSLRLKSCKR